MTAIELTKEMEKLEKVLFAFGLNLTKDKNEALDLYQEMAYRAIRNVHHFRPDTNLRAWLMTIMRNVFINAYRKKRTRQTYQDGSLNQYLINSTSETVANLGESKLVYDELISIVHNLEDYLRIPFLLNYEGYKYQEIADELGIPVGTVKSRIFIARKRIKQAIKRNNKIRYDEELSAA